VKTGQDGRHGGDGKYGRWVRIYIKIPPSPAHGSPPICAKILSEAIFARKFVSIALNNYYVSQKEPNTAPDANLCRANIA